MFQETYRIELRQIDVKPLNGRHYFWVLKKVIGRGRSRVLGELHGQAADWKTGRPKSSSFSGDQLKFYDVPGENRYEDSLKLPFAIADIDHKEHILRRWGEGIRVARSAGTGYSGSRTRAWTTASVSAIEGRAPGGRTDQNPNFLRNNVEHYSFFSVY